MTIIIDWKLYTNNELEIEINDCKCEYEKQNYLIVNEEDAINKIDIKNKLYIRKCNDYEMTIDFNNNLCNLNIPSIKNYEFDLDCKMNIKKDIIEIFYTFDKEVKKIKIKLKEECK